ncbi:MAG: DUF2189 domain-containing protein [Pseudomonadota bacterium]
MTSATMNVPAVQNLTVGDLIEVLGAGVRDFVAAPQYGLFFGGIYAIAGWVIIAFLFYYKLLYLAYPLAMGFALIAPFAAVGFYAVSRALEKGEKLSWSGVLGAVGGTTKSDLRWMALVTSFAFFLWMDIAAILFLSIMGFDALGPQFFELVFTTSTGWLFLLVGNAVGAVIAFMVFSICVVSFPMLLDRDVDFATAMVTSVKVVKANPATMFVWLIIIGLLTGLSLLSGFIGLFVMLPVVGHATWHLYRRAVAHETAEL